MRNPLAWCDPVAAARRLGLGSNPLRRMSDRIEGAVVALLIVTALLAVPVSLSVGSTVYGQADLAGSPVLGQAVLIGFAVFLGCLLGLVAGYALTRWLLDRKRSTGWEAEWARVEPEWTRHTS